MKTYEDFIAEFHTEKEYERTDVKEILDVLGQYHHTMSSYIEQAERMFLMAGEMCGYNAADICKTCQEKK